MILQSKKRIFNKRSSFIVQIKTSGYLYIQDNKVHISSNGLIHESNLSKLKTQSYKTYNVSLTYFFL